MRPLADLVRLGEPAAELVVKLVQGYDTEVVDEQALGVRRGTPDPRILDPSHQIEVSVERFRAEGHAGEATAGSLERDGGLGHRVAKRSASGHQVNEPVIQPDDLDGLAGEMALDRPLIVAHPAMLAQRRGRSSR